jgi:GWxTD domain-containing protein
MELGMKKIAAFCILVIPSCMLLPLSMRAQRAAPESQRDADPIKLDILSFANESSPSSDTVRADLYVAVPYSSLEFLRLRDNYGADYSVALTAVEKGSSSTALSRFQNYRVVEPMTEHTSRVEARVSKADAEQLSLPLRAGTTYALHLTFRDENARREIDTTVSFTTKSFRGSQPALSDLMLYRSRRGSRVVPSIGSDVASLDRNDAGVFAEAYHVPADSLLGVVVEIVLPPGAGDASTGPLARRTSTFRTPSASTHPAAIFQNVSFDDLWTGRYLLRLYLLPHATDTSLTEPSQLSARAIATSAREITVSSSHGIPLATANLDEAIEQLRLITTGSEWDSLSSAKTTTEKREAIVDFWQKRMPTTARPFRGAGTMRGAESENRQMKIFYARIAYTNAHFASGLRGGWRSDRGRVYVALGPPDAVDRHPYDANQKPYEVWQYSSPMNVRYYFVDSYMLGDYRLNGAPPSQGTFVWQ